MKKKDPYLDFINEHWDKIFMMYEKFQDKKPIVVYDLETRRIISCPAEEYINNLTERTRKQTWKQYREAIKTGKFMVFIRDAENKRLRSYVFRIQE